MQNLKIEANKHFINQNFDLAYKLYSMVLSQDPEDEDAKIGMLLCDLSSYSPKKAIKLFKKYEKGSIDMQELLNESELFSQEEKIEMLNGVLYRDIKEKLNNKIFIQNLIMSAPILFLSKDEILEFIDILNEYDMQQIAFEYIEKIEPQINSIIDISEIYNRLLNDSKN
jgi:5'-3' exonuclease